MLARVFQVSQLEELPLVVSGWGDSPKDCWNDEVALARADAQGLGWGELALALGLKPNAEWDVEKTLVGAKVLVDARESPPVDVD